MPGRVASVRAGLHLRAARQHLPPAVVGPADRGRRRRPRARAIPDRAVQLIDARDLAAWMLDLAEQRVAGAFNGTAPPGQTTMREVLEAAVAATGSGARLHWVPDDALVAHGVEPWTSCRCGSRPRPAGDVAVGTERAQAAGLRCRPVADTVADTWAWLRDGGAAADGGLARRAPPARADRERSASCRESASRPLCRGSRHGARPEARTEHRLLDRPPARRPGSRQIAEAERLGFDSIWTAEAYGSDVPDAARLVGRARPSSMQLGTAIVQMSARQPAATAMAAMTMDHLSGGRFILGLGVSGPQVVEGWYGQPFAKPLARTREYVAILRDIVARAGAGHQRRRRTTRCRCPDGTGLGKPLKSHDPPAARGHPDLPRRRGPEEHRAGRRALRRLAGAASSRPRNEDFYRDALAEGFARERRAAQRPTTSRSCATVPLIVPDDVEAAADMLRPMYALYFGGMGAKGANFHADVPIRMGYEAEVEQIQDLYLDGQEGRGRRGGPDAS